MFLTCFIDKNLSEDRDLWNFALSVTLKYVLMKRLFLSFVLLVATSLAACAFSYEEAREEAYFLTDKMAYELNLTSEQYNRVYQVNLDYLLSVNSGRDRMALFLDYRETDLRYILTDWQFSLYRTLAYFCTPVEWRSGGWHFVIYDRYRRGYLYFGRPTVFVSYRGQAWGLRRPHEASPYRYAPRRNGRGMRDFYFDDRGRRPEPGAGGPLRSDRNGGPGATRPARPGGQVSPGATNASGGSRPSDRPGPATQPGNSKPDVRPGSPAPAVPGGGSSAGAGSRPSTGYGAGTTTSRGASGRSSSATVGQSNRVSSGRVSSGRASSSRGR